MIRMRMMAFILALGACASVASAQTVSPGPLVVPAPALGPVIAPAPPSEYGRGVEPLPRPDVAQPLPPPEIDSPVTGYGFGGMEAPPGAPSVPPYGHAPFATGH
jgi:hypothetical protein